MLLVSNNLLEKTTLQFHEKTIMRVNVAWIKNLKELKAVLARIKHDVFLDYPQGRSKPPKPTISLAQTLLVAKKSPNVKYFAVSNVENPTAIHRIRKQLPNTIQLVPKIETKKGIEMLEHIVKKIDARHIMLDKEDLYLDIKRNNKLFHQLVTTTRTKGAKHGFEVLELQGVVFVAPDGHNKTFA